MVLLNMDTIASYLGAPADKVDCPKVCSYTAVSTFIMWTLAMYLPWRPHRNHCCSCRRQITERSLDEFGQETWMTGMNST